MEKTLHLKDLYRNTTIKELNLRIKNILRADPIIQKIVFNGRKVAGGDKDLQYYGIKKNSVLHLDLLPFSSSPSFKDKKDKKKNIIFKRFINPNFINKLYDNAFHLLSSHCNWIKFAIDNKQIISKDWKISYHGASRFYNAQVSSLQNVVVKNEPSTTNITTNNHKISLIKSLKLNNPDIQDLPSILQIFVNGNVYNHALIQYKNVESVKNAI
ncbi:8796_t:CDS:2 [Entrophospora sp. SA101]|nr:8796_t:CDS:2 [Entrophospora sp. SA101]